MNKRIVKLFMESVDSNYIPVPIEDHIPSWTAKFAELIVRECALVVFKKTGPKSALDVLEHFGVEE